MASDFVDAINYLLSNCPCVISLQDLLTKTRIELENDCFLELYYNETLGKYAYTLIEQDRRVVGWDNAPHHPGLANFPHHFHAIDGTIHPSDLTGSPKEDMAHVVEVINTMLG